MKLFGFEINKAAKNKIEQEDIDDLRRCYTRTVRLGIHIQAHPKDDDNKEEFIIYKEENNVHT